MFSVLHEIASQMGQLVQSNGTKQLIILIDTLSSGVTLKDTWMLLICTLVIPCMCWTSTTAYCNYLMPWWVVVAVSQRLYSDFKEIINIFV